MPQTPMESQSAATLDTAHVGDIEGAFGTTRLGDEAPRSGLKARQHTHKQDSQLDWVVIQFSGKGDWLWRGSI